MTERGAMLPGRNDPIVRTMPTPANLNANGHIFGGWVLSQMDIAGGILASRRARSNCTTVSIDRMSFIAPILVGDIVSVYGNVEKVGRTSIQIRLEVIATRLNSREDVQVTEGLFTFVAIDEQHRPQPPDRD